MTRLFVTIPPGLGAVGWLAPGALCVGFTFPRRAGRDRRLRATRAQTREPGCRDLELRELGDNTQNGTFQSEYFYTFASYLEF